ncbi:MAG: tRNA (N6-isopentenyl adenosine(37)-C2)-methylthiotransferase MiaB [Deltaproteobacteria bacterium]|nr:tRNA (N6-isopentenyl adenosine(37)-C2)-methylthiotransferase MiaB [Deltaproteobacteria bacterium]
MKAYIKTFGCQMNEQDSEVMKGLLARQGYEQVAKPEEAELILINTCSIREKSYQKAMSTIGRNFAGAIVGVAGCVASQAGEKLLKRFQNVDFVLGTDQIHRLPEVLERVKGNHQRVVYTDFQDLSDYEFPVPLTNSQTKQVKAYVTIMKGCDNACSFCIVPLTRGGEVSRSPQEILEEIRGLQRNGVREVMLLGQNVNSYGKRLSPKITFAELLRLIEAGTSLDRIRFTSPHPKDLSKDLVREYGRNRRLCPHIHLPVQSGSNKILKAMRRSYTREIYLRRVAALRKVCPDVAITTDMIIGFPGETEPQFEETLRLVEEVGFDQSYYFEYSPRPGTEAFRLVDNVPQGVKKERLQRLQLLQERISEAKNRLRIGKIEAVLVEGPSLQGGGQLSGRTPHGRIVNFVGRERMIGAIIPVKILKVSPYSLGGEVSVD